jgi:hypothetical protein
MPAIWPWASSIWFTYSQLIFTLSTLILSSHLHLISECLLLALSILTHWEAYKWWSYLQCNFLHFPIIISILVLSVLLSTLFSNIYYLMPSDIMMGTSIRSQFTHKYWNEIYNCSVKVMWKHRDKLICVTMKISTEEIFYECRHIWEDTITTNCTELA